MHTHEVGHRAATRWLAATVGAIALLLATPAIGHAEESNPNNDACLGHTAVGTPEAGSEEQQVRYTFYCNGPITGYQLQSQIPLTGVQGAPLVTNMQGNALTDTFSCAGDIPGYAVNCVGSAKGAYENVTGQFAIGAKLCAEPRVDPLLTVTYAYLEKGVLTQAISGPFDLGRPLGCHPDSSSGGDRLDPKAPSSTKEKSGKGHKKGKRGAKKNK